MALFGHVQGLSLDMAFPGDRARRSAEVSTSRKDRSRERRGNRSRHRSDRV